MMKPINDWINTSNVGPWVKKYGLVFLIAFSVWLLYAIVGPGDDYKRCYTWMVVEPERLPLNANYPWTSNPPWLALFMSFFVALPGRAGYIVFMAFSLFLFIVVARYYGGRVIPMLLSAQIMWIMWWGQIEAFAVLGLMLAKEAVDRKNWKLMFLALVLASFKPQVGIVPVLAYWWWSGRERWKSVTALAILFGLSLLVWGPWPVWYAEGIIKFATDDHAERWNASLGLIAAPLFLPAMLVPMEREKRVMALAATALIVSPYLPYYSTIILLMWNLPVWAYFFAFIGYFPTVIGTKFAWNIVVLLPITVLLWLYFPFFKQMGQRIWKANFAHR